MNYRDEMQIDKIRAYTLKNKQAQLKLLKEKENATKHTLRNAIDSLELCSDSRRRSKLEIVIRNLKSDLRGIATKIRKQSGKA